MQIKKFNYSTSKITSLVVDLYSGFYLWLGFAKDNNICILKKVSANNPLQTYFLIEENIDAFKKLIIYATFIYTAIDDETYIGKRYSLLTPLTTTNNFLKQSDAKEVPIDIQTTSDRVFFLLPGNISGEYAKIYIYTLAGVYIETIELSTIQHVSSFVVIDNNNLWAVTDTSPSELIRIYNDGTWNYSSF